jgi:2,3-bisphosphoglycerate-independent phosphoglycerate mutase
MNEIKEAKDDVTEKLIEILKPLVEQFAEHLKDHDANTEKVLENYLVKNNLLFQVQKSKETPNYIG